MSHRRLTTTVLVLCAVATAQPHAQTRVSKELPRARPVVTIRRVSHAPKLEDYLDMGPGPSAPAMTKVTGFVERNPQDGAPAQEQTDVYVGYDATALYAVFVCFDAQPRGLRARMTRREDIGPDHDQVQLYLDTFADQRRAYGFMINPLGIQYDFIWTETLGYDPSWDTVWNSTGKVTPNGYVAVMSIPFKSLRFPATPTQTWGILFERVIPHDNDDSFYPPVSTSIQGRLNQEAELRGLEGISPGRNVQLNPYGVAAAVRTLDARNPNAPVFTADQGRADVGLDGKVVLKDSLVLDVTLNPDFRQLESDQPQNTVNQRFEKFFPEKRPFFQEGANFFDTPINMYFTRRIVDPQVGVRLTGKLGPYGIGLLASDDRHPGRVVPDDDPLHHTRAYFTVARIARELWRQSQVGVFYSDREMSAVAHSLCSTTARTTTEQTSCISNSNRVAGPDMTLRFGDHVRMQGQALASVTHEVGGTHMTGNLYALSAEYSGRHLQYTTSLRDIGAGFTTLTGFAQQPDIRREHTYFVYVFRPETPHVTSWGPHLLHNLTFDHHGNRLDALYEPALEIHFKQNTDFYLYGGNWHELLRPSDYPALTANHEYNKGGYWGFSVNSAYLRWISFTGGYFSGKNINFAPPANQVPFLAGETQANLDTTLHPLNALTMTNSYILERLSTRTAPTLGIVDSHIFRSKVSYQYTPRLSVRMIAEYRTQAVNPTYTNLDHSRQFNADVLITYLIHPGTAWYLGYSSTLENFDPAAIATHTGLIRANRLLNDDRTIYVKMSYLFRF